MPRQPVTGASWLRFGTNPSLQDVPGGIVDIFTANNVLNVGDAVYLQGVSTVDKSTVVGNQGKPAGIVVGGAQTRMECYDDISDPGILAANAGDQVVVLLQGKCFVVADAAIAAGTPIAMSTTVAGRVRPATALVINAGGTAVTSTAANGAIVGGDGANTIIGIAKQAAAGAASVILALINAA